MQFIAKLTFPQLASFTPSIKFGTLEGLTAGPNYVHADSDYRNGRATDHGIWRLDSKFFDEFDFQVCPGLNWQVGICSVYVGLDLAVTDVGKKWACFSYSIPFTTTFRL